MKIIVLAKVAIFCVLSSSAYAQDNYHGLVVAHVVKNNGHIYRGVEEFTNTGEFNDQQLIFYSQERG